MNKSSILNRLILTSLVSIFVAACSVQNGLPKVDASTENDGGAPQEAGGQTDTTSEEDAPINSGSCDDGTYDDDSNEATACLAWSECEPGTKIVGEGTTTLNRSCNACAPGTFSAERNAVTCNAWTDCPAGDFTVAPGSLTSDRQCMKCPVGKFTASPNSSACVAIGSCAPGTEQTAAASGSTPAICVPCLAGTYCAGGTAPKQTCGVGADTWDSDGNSATACVARSICLAGTKVGNDGSGTTQRDCVACPIGTYSTTQNSGSCVNCVNGYNTAPGSASCTPFTANGVACGTGRCASGNCINGVCCSSASCGSCQRCDLNGAGTCSAVAAGQPDLANMCVDQGAASCGNNGVCDGNSGCQKYACMCDAYAMPNPASAGLPNPASYTAGSGFVTDNVTKLVWEQPISAATFTQAAAIKYCTDKGGGWRLPKVVELYSLVDFTRSNPAIDVVYFPNTPDYFFWTSSAVAGNPSSAWYVYFQNGDAYYDGVDQVYQVRCVR